MILLQIWQNGSLSGHVRLHRFSSVLESIRILHYTNLLLGVVGQGTPATVHVMATVHTCPAFQNVFIAVITETFAEIRVQFSQMWGSRELMTEEEIRQVIEKGEEGWRLVAMDSNKSEGWAPKVCQDFHRSTAFQIIAMLLVLSNAIINASFVYKHDSSDEIRKQYYYYIEVNRD